MKKRDGFFKRIIDKMDRHLEQRADRQDCGCCCEKEKSERCCK